MSTANAKIRLSTLLYATKREEGGYNLIFYNGVYMGEVLKDDDGFYKYWPVQRAGYWDSPPLRAIADLLDHLNAEWDAQIQRNLGA